MQSINEQLPPARNEAPHRGLSTRVAIGRETNMTEADWLKAVLSVITTALGVLFGLLGTGYVTWRREGRAYRAMLIAIASEGQNNKAVLNNSFMKYYDRGIVLREFSTATIERCVGDPLFVKHGKSAHLDIIYEYLRNVCLANSYREKAEQLQLGHDKKAADAWLGTLIEVWGDNLKQCKTNIDQVIALPENDSR